MIVIDTNVLSEPMKSTGDPFFTTPSLAEVLFGLACLPPSRRREGLATRLEKLIANLFGSRLLEFDVAAARVCPDLVANARASGRSIGVADGYIAAIAASRGFAVATRDRSPFEAAGLSVIDPWTAA